MRNDLALPFIVARSVDLKPIKFDFSTMDLKLLSLLNERLERDTAIEKLGTPRKKTEECRKEYLCVLEGRDLLEKMVPEMQEEL